MERFIRYNVDIDYDDLFSNSCTLKYSFFAKDEEDAKRIAYECFLMEVGSSESIRLNITSTLVSDGEKDYISNTIKSYLGELRKSLHDKSYMDFIKLFQDMQGYDLNLSNSYNSFWIDFNNITCKIVYEEGVCSIDLEEVIVKDKTSNRKYVVKNNLQDYYIGV